MHEIEGLSNGAAGICCEDVRVLVGCDALVDLRALVEYSVCAVEGDVKLGAAACIGDLDLKGEVLIL